MSNERALQNATLNEILAELQRRNTAVAIGDTGVYLLDTAEVTVVKNNVGQSVAAIKISLATPPAGKARSDSFSFDPDQYFLDLVERGVSTVDARRLANLAADVDALARSLAKEYRR